MTVCANFQPALIPGSANWWWNPTGVDRQHEQDEHHSRQRIAEQPAASHLRQHAVPDHVGRQQPEVHERMAEPPEEGPRHQRIDLCRSAQRPRDQHADHFHREAGGRQVPDDDRRQHAVNRERRRHAGVLAPPRPVARDDRPRPRSTIRRRAASRRYRRADAPAAADRTCRGRCSGRAGSSPPRHRPGGADPEREPADASAGDPPEALLGEHVAEPHDEERREDQRHEDAVRRHR